jgi:hypothetical protein
MIETNDNLSWRSLGDYWQLDFLIRVDGLMIDASFILANEPFKWRKGLVRSPPRT